MSALEKIRSKAVFLIVIIAFALLCFIIGDLLTSSSSIVNMNRSVVGDVDGNEISIEQFNQQSEELSEILKSQSQRDASDAEVKSMVWDNFVQTSILNHEGEEAGFRVTSEEMNDQTVGSNMNPMLRQISLFYNGNGQFDKNMVPEVFRFLAKDPESIPEDKRENFVEQQAKIRGIWMFWEKNLKNQLMAEKIISVVSAALSAPKAEVNYLAALSKNDCDALVARKLLADVPDKDVTVSDQEIADYYNKFQKTKYKTEGYRNLQIVLFPIQPSNSDYNAAKVQVEELRSQLAATNDAKQLKILFESSSERAYPFTNFYRTSKDLGPQIAAPAFALANGAVSDVMYQDQLFYVIKSLGAVSSRPDSVRISMIALTAASLDAAKLRADSVSAAIKAGASFDELCKKLSADKNSSAKNGDLGWVREGTITMEGFDDKAFAGKKGNVFTMSDENNNNAAFVIKVTDQTTPVKKAKIAVLANRLEESTETNDSIYNKANQVVSSSKDMNSFMAFAKKNNYQVRPLNNLGKNQPTTYVLPESRSIIKWAWEDGRKEGNVSNVFTEIPGYYIVASVKDIVEEGFIPLDKVKDEITTKLRNDKKAVKLCAQLKGVKDLNAVGKVDTALNVNFSSVYAQGVGSEPAVISAIAKAKLNTISNPVKGNAAVFVFKKIAERPSQTPAIGKESINQNVMQLVNRQLFIDLKDKADVEDNRYNFF